MLLHHHKWAMTVASDTTGQFPQPPSLDGAEGAGLGRKVFDFLLHTQKWIRDWYGNSDEQMSIYAKGRLQITDYRRRQLANPSPIAATFSICGSHFHPSS
jgi:hypothetical protein